MRELIYGVAAIGIILLIGLLLFCIAAVVAIGSAGRHRRRYLDGGINIVDEMSQSQFGRYVGEYFARQGYNVERVSWPTAEASALVLQKGIGELTFVCAVRSADGVKDHVVHQAISQAELHKGSEVMIVTNSVLLQSAEKIAAANTVKRIERHDFIPCMGKANMREIAEEVTQTP